MIDIKPVKDLLIDLQRLRRKLDLKAEMGEYDSTARFY
jgi:hypothetical protein